MNDWPDLEAFISERFVVSSRDAGVLRVVFDFDDGRSQIVIIERTEDDEGHVFASISSPFSADLDLPWPEVLRRAADWVVGGVAAIGETAFIRHAVPLADLDPDEFLVPLHAVMVAADVLEEEFAGNDRF